MFPIGYCLDPIDFCELTLLQTMALYHYAKGRPLQRMLSPPFRDLWLEWEDKLQDEQGTAKAVEEEDRAKFFLDVWSMWKQKVRQSAPLPKHYTS